MMYFQIQLGFFLQNVHKFLDIGIQASFLKIPFDFTMTKQTEND